MARPPFVVSYARVDRDLVRAGVEFLRATWDRRGVVFWVRRLCRRRRVAASDETGDSACDKVFVFWCRHSARSRPVTDELAYAFARRRSVVPVLVDDTPLNRRLAPITGVDLRGLLRHPPFPGSPGGFDSGGSDRFSGPGTSGSRRAKGARAPEPELGPFLNAAAARRFLSAFRPFIEDTLAEVENGGTPSQSVHRERPSRRRLRRKRSQDDDEAESSSDEQKAEA